MSNKRFGLDYDQTLKDIRKNAEKDYVLGGKELPIEILQQDGQWTPYDPELQRRGLEPMACVSFSLLNCIEMLFKKKFDDEINKSDRFLAKVSETTRQGNSFRKVAEAMRKKGAVKEETWAYGDITSWSEYYKVIPNSVFRKAEKWLQQYSFGYEWVYSWAGLSIAQKQQKIMEALQYSPLQVPVYAWTRQKGGIYLDERRQPNHGTVLYGYVAGKYWKIYDSYNNVFKKLEWNYNFRFAMRFSLLKINDNSMKLKLYKDWESNTVYAKGDNAGSGKFHPIASENFILQFANDWGDIYVKNLDRKLRKEEIGATIGTYSVFIKLITNLFK